MCFLFMKYDCVKFIQMIILIETQIKRTKQAMGGNMSFREALHIRLAIIRPSLQTVHEFNAATHSAHHNLTPRVDELVSLLHSRHIPVYLVSGGFRLIINPVADRLGIERTRVFANTLKFDSEGNYESFCEAEMTSESGGKGRVIEHLKQTLGYRNVIMVGDGATDLESCPPADGFIGFGGNVVRDKVKQNSDWFVYSFGELIEHLK
jgi:phosphoserine phosphatase